MTEYDPIHIAFEKARNLLEGANENLDALPKAVATFLLVHGAQGTIDNGGFRYFFGSDWPDNPPYSRFVEAYRIIGCETQAKELDRIVHTFPFDNPHLCKDKRNEFIAKYYDKTSYEVSGWGDALCGDEDVWKKLAIYFEENALDFESSKPD
ncbi:MAG: DUF4375 domain-containing protein [Methylococcaceae bacterium]|nr:DUF4375 domain-containing protein [Methylococcaceae bacterium]